MKFNLSIIISLIIVLVIVFVVVIVLSKKKSKLMPNSYNKKKKKNKKQKLVINPTKLVLGVVVLFIILILFFVYFVIKNVDKKERKSLRAEKLAEAALLEKEKAEREAKEREAAEQKAREEGKFVPSPDLLAFNVVNNIPPIFKTENMLTKNYFIGIIPYNRDKLCYYYSMSSKSYKFVTGQDKEYLSSNGKDKILITYDECMDKSTDVNKLYDIYAGLFKDYIKTNENMPKAELERVIQTKATKIKNYFNMKEDFPSFLPLTVVPYLEFTEIMKDDKHKEDYCIYSVNLQNASNKIVSSNKKFKPTILGSPDYALCRNNFSLDQEYIKYEKIVTYITSWDTLSEDEQGLANALLPYKMPLS